MQQAAMPTVLFVGTSLTAGYGLPDPNLAYPRLLQHKADSAGYRVRLVNAGVSGETSAGALRRMDWLLQEPVAGLVLETGANDGLRGQDPDSLRANIEAILDRALRQDPAPRLLLVGMEAMPNLGFRYVRRFRTVFPDVAKEYDVPLVPFLLDGVAGSESLNQPDGIHPTAEGQRRMAETMWPYVEAMLREIAPRGA
ncbi:MAG TPA: arylesterase [Gemmatimonadales bacterium]|nr:arylesterase [Gemmatimonadales bacterium]